jgi:hypothetical protein
MLAGLAVVSLAGCTQEGTDQAGRAARTPREVTISTIATPPGPAGFTHAWRGKDHRVIYVDVDEGQRQQFGPCWVDYKVSSIHQTEKHLTIQLIADQRGDVLCAQAGYDSYLPVHLSHPYDGATATNQWGITRRIVPVSHRTTRSSIFAESSVARTHSHARRARGARPCRQTS